MQTTPDSKKEGSSFLKKRSKKLLASGARVATGTRANVQKFFAAFFQKRTACRLWPPETLDFLSRPGTMGTSCKTRRAGI
jgi:hypothetical protein